jgi:hypothetical protein
MTAAEMQVTKFQAGMKFRISDPSHTYAGRSGVLDINKDGSFWLHDINVMGRFVGAPVRPEQLVLVEQKVAA